MLRLSDLSARPDQRVGTLFISAARRTLRGPTGTTTLEPRVMQVLACLLDRHGEVVTRDALLEECWASVSVGDDSLNRSIAKLRRALADVAGDDARIETVPRTGYRLRFEGVDDEASRAEGEERGVSRRLVLAGGATVLTAAALGGFALLRGSDGETAEWVRVADRRLRDQYPGSGKEAAGLLTQAAEREPGNARVWGLLALAHRDMAETGERDEVPAQVEAGIRAAERALSLERDQSEALTAKATLRPEYGNWLAVERALREILERDPGNVHATMYLTMLLQQVGRARESEALNARAIELDPLTPVPQFRRGLKEWIFGRNAAAYSVIDRAFQTWPRHPAVWSARLYIYIFTGRAAEALTMLGDDVARPPGFGEAFRAYFETLARAAASEESGPREAARAMLTDVSSNAIPFAIAGIMGLSHLGYVDEAYAVTQGAFLGTGPYQAKLWVEREDPQVSDQYWRRTMNLFTPAALPLRLDPRWDGLCQAMGMERYWRDSGTRPDAFLFRIPQRA